MCGKPLIICASAVLLCLALSAAPAGAVVRSYVEEVFGCPVLNQYGSREVGVIACECMHKEGLHTFGMNNKIEILDSNLQPCAPGQMGLAGPVVVVKDPAHA